MPALGKNEAGLAKKLFSMADRDKSGYIQFGEFAELHHHLTKLGERLSTRVIEQIGNSNQAALEKEFRELDRDHDMTLDQKEWMFYMESLHSVLGKKTYDNVCKVLLEEKAKEEKAWAAGHDRVASQNLMEKAKCTTYLTKQHEGHAKELLDRKADPNVQDDNGNTAVIEFASKCHSSFMLKLLEKGADFSVNNKDLDCAVFAAARARRCEVLRVLVLGTAGHADADEEQTAEEEDPSAVLIRDMNNFGENEVRHLVNRGADINFKDDNGWTPLHSAVFWGKRECVETLIRLPQMIPRLRLSVDLRNAKGRTALHVAARKGKAELVSLLINARCSPDARDMDGWTPLHHAVFNCMDENVELLIDNSSRANLFPRGLRGFTPFMIHESPQRSGAPLRKEIMKKLAPPESVNFAKTILPILKDENLTPYERLDSMLRLPAGGNHKLCHLRIYDQVFHPKRGPNKIQLGKIWELMGKEMLKRVLSGECDLDPPGPHLDEKENQKRAEEIKEREKIQRDFVEEWLLESAGPPVSTDWSFDNREGYKDELRTAIEEHLEGFKRKMERVYEVLKNEKDAEELLGLPSEEVVATEYLDQNWVHPIPEWLESMSAVGAFSALREVKAFGERGDEEDSEALLKFIELVTSEYDFREPKLCWQNVYKLWLANYGNVANAPFQAKMKKYVEQFNTNYADRGYKVSHLAGSPKTYQALKARETDFGTPSHSTFNQRRIAGKQLDVIRCTMLPNCAAACVAIIEEFKMAGLQKDKYELVQVFNGYSPKSTPTESRRIRMNIVFNGGERNIPWTHGRSLAMRVVGEIDLYLPGFHELHQGMQIMDGYMKGKYEPKVL